MNEGENRPPHTELDKKYFDGFFGKIELEKRRELVTDNQIKRAAEIVNGLPKLIVPIQEIDAATENANLDEKTDTYLGTLLQLRREIYEAVKEKSITKDQGRKYLKKVGLKEVKEGGTKKRIQSRRGKKSK